MLRDFAKEKVRQLVESYDSVVRLGKKAEYSEADVGSKFILPLLSALGWDVTKIEDVKEQKRTLTGVADYSLLNVGGTAKIFLELKKFEEDLDGSRRVGGKVKSFPQMAIDYAWQSRADWAVLTNFEETRLYYSRVKKPEEGLIFKLKYHECLANFDKLWLISKESVVTGLLDTYEKRRLRRDVDEELLKDLVYCRKLLVANVRKNNPKLSKDDINEATQKILDRLMFIRSCEDRLIIPAESLWTQFSVWQKIAIDKSVRTFMMDLKNIFRDFDAVYNGQLFAPHLCEDLQIENEVLEAVLILLYNYNFDLIPVNVLGNAYELYIGTIIKEKEGTLKEDELTLVEDPSVRKKHGIYYTPEYVVDYIVRNTLGEILKNCKTLDEVSKIKVLDPACGSGSFLIKAFDVIKEWYSNYNEQNRRASTPNTLDAHFDVIPDIEYKISSENLYGVDVDPQAVEITMLNLSLKAVKTRKKLPYMGTHIKCGNSLIDAPEAAGNKAFKWEEQFKEIIDEHGFDVVIGNPPYVDIKQLEPATVRYLFGRYNTVENRMNLYSTFVEKAFDLLKEGGYFGFIIPNSILYNKSYQKIRTLLLNNATLLKIVRLPDKVFEHAKIETIILVYKKGTPAKEKCEVLVYPRKAKISSINKEECTQVLYFDQSTWNTDFKIINISADDVLNKLLTKIERETKPLKDLCDFSLGLTPYDKYKGHTQKQIKQRVFHSQTKKDETFKPLLSGENITRYGVFWDSKEYISYGHWLGAPREKRFFTERRILVRQIVSGEPPRIYAGYSEEELYNTQIAFNIIGKNEKALPIKYILAILNSKLMSFYHKEKYLDPTKHLFQKILIANAKKFPIKIASQDVQEKVVNLVDGTLLLNDRTKQISTDYDRYLTEPIIAYANFKEYYNKLDVKNKEALDKTSRGTVKRIQVIEQDSWLVFKVDYFTKTNKTREEFTNIPVLRCKFEEKTLQKFVLYTFQNYKKRWGSGNLLSIILNTPIPCFDKNLEKNKQIIEKIMKEFLKAVEEKERIEKEIQQTDNTIDSKVYELYGLTPEEISIVENSLKQK